MVSTSESYNTAVAALSRRFRARITMGTDVLEGESISALVQTAGSCGGDAFSIGSVFASYVDVTLSLTDISLAGREMYIEIGLYLPDGTLEYVPMGYYTVSPSDISRTSDQITLKATDRVSSRCGGLYVPTVAFPATIGAVISDIETQAGISVKTSFDTTGTIEASMDNLLYRETLGYIAGILGGFVYADRDGNICIAPFPTSGTEVVADRCLTDPALEEDDYTVTAVTVVVSEGGEDADGNTVEGESYTSGTGEGISVSNPYMTEALFDAMAERVVGYAFRPGTVTFLGDPRLGPEDAVEVVNSSGEAFLIPCMSITHTYDGGLTTSVTAPGQASSDEGVSGPLTQQIERLATEMVLAKEVIAKKLTADEADLKYLTADSAIIKELVADIANIDIVLSTEITTKYLEANYADIKFANVDTASITTGFLQSLMVSQGLVADSITAGSAAITGYLTGVGIVADTITAGTLSVERLLITGEDSIIYEINAKSSGLTATELTDEVYQNYLNGTTIVANSITATQIAAGTITGNEIAANSITADHLSVDTLSAITANIGQLVIDGYLTTNTSRTTYNQAVTGMTISAGGIGGWGSSSKYWYMTNDGDLYATSGTIGGVWKLSTTGIYNGTTSMTSTTAGTFIGSAGFRQYASANQYVNIQSGQILMTGYLTLAVSDGDGTSATSYDSGIKFVTGNSLTAGAVCTIKGESTSGGILTLSAGDRVLIDPELYVEYITGTNDKLYITTATSVSDTLSVSGATTLNSTLAVTGNATFKAIAYFANGTTYYVNASGNAKFNTLTTAGTATFGSTLSVAGAISAAGGTMTGNIVIEKSSGWTGVQATRSDTGISVSLQIGSGGSNHGMYSDACAEWIAYCDSSGNMHLGQTTVGSSTVPIYLKSGVPTECYPNYLYYSGTDYVGVSSSMFGPTNDCGDAVLTLGRSSYRWKTIYASSSTISTSDANEKTEIISIDEVRERLFMSLRPVTYMWRNFRNTDSHDRIHCGLVAQEVLAACTKVGLSITEFGALCRDDLEEPTIDGRTERYGLRYEEFVPLTIHMVQKNVSRIEALEAKVAEQAETIATQNETILQMQEEIKQLKAVA